MEETHRLCIHQLFQCQVAKTPEAVAVVDGDRTFTYRELDQITDSLAGYLQEHGVQVEQRVGILMEKCAEYIIACLAALKAGGAYLPLDMAYPKALLSNIVRETQSPVIVTKNRYRERLGATLSTNILTIDTDRSWRDASYNEEEVVSIRPDHLAYIVYSSGTTGEPKGILAPHRGAVHSYDERYKISSYQPGDRVACNIFFVWEFFRPLLKGATVYIIPDDIIYDPKQLTQFLAENEITEVLLTPSLMATSLNTIDHDILQARLASLQVLWLNGEAVTTRLKHQALAALPDHVQLFNTYSISECHDVSSLDLRESEDTPSGFCPVGHPIDGITVGVWDDRMQQVSRGEVGELYIGGPCLARGYLHKPALTAERFVWHEGERFYRTGDVALIHPNGHLEIRGRCDSMVKIRGYSVHLGAIEIALLRHADVQSCVVIAQGEEGEDKRLVAYVIRGEHADWNIHPGTGTCVALRERLKAHLADYMIPSVYVELDALPLSPATGKLHHHLLPVPPRQDGDDAADIHLPETPSKAQQREVMRTLWERVLSLEAGSIQDDSDFFDYGGHSLLAVRLTSWIEKIFHTQLMVKTIFTYSTVATLVDCLGNQTETGIQNVSIQKDAKLPPELVPAPDQKPLALREAHTIFLTGATGFLGAFLLNEILRTTDSHVKVYCLTRTKPGASRDAFRRIMNSLERYDLWHEHDKGRIIPVIGDLSQAYLGMQPEYFDRISREVDFIFHCAAYVNYMYPYTLLKPHTVDGTQEVIRLAFSQFSKPVYYISTNGVFPGGDGEPYVENRDIDAFGDRLVDGYCQSKWVAEKLIWDAAARGLPVCVFRPGNVGHHSITGVVNPNDFQYHIMDACMKVNGAPDIDTWAFEMTPVDFLAKAIVQFARHPSHIGQVYNVVQSDPMSARTIFDLLMKKGYLSQYVPMDTWMETLYTKAEESQDHLLSVLAESLRDVEPYLMDDSVYDCSRFDKATQAYGMHRPLTDLDYFERFIQRYLSP